MLSSNKPIGSLSSGVSGAMSMGQNMQTIDNIKVRNQMRRQNKAMVNGNRDALSKSVSASGMSRPVAPLAKKPVVRNRSAKDYHQ